ncbi:MAG: 4-hydroxy-tetrahydrodipicolinate synthase [Candidatus Thorarchaeota archaeon]|jgi:4-hydroxy-tetrahydrodipicolinate synthase
MKFVPRGILPAMVTPFTNDDKINKQVLRELVDYLISNGVHGLFAVGSQGEFYALTKEEKKQILEIVVDQSAGRVPVYAGTGAVATREVIELNEIAEQIGVDAVSILTPYFINPTQEELYGHYREIAQATRLPILVYNNPGRTGINMSAKLVERLADIDNIIGIKDSSGDITLTGEYIRQTNAKEFYVLAGRDTLILATLLYGGGGSIAATANVVPSMVVDIYNYFVEGNIEKAKEAQRALAPLRISFELGTFPVVIKEALEIIGIDAGPARAPVKDLDAKSRNNLKKILGEMTVRR